MKDVELAYVAGFFDGDGSVGVYWAKHRRGRHGGYYTLRANIGQRHYLPLFDLLLEQFGGFLSYRKKGSMWQWTVGSAQALRFLEAILPYSRNKRPQVELAVKFQKRMRRHGPPGLTPDEFAWQEAIAGEIKRLKKAESLSVRKPLLQRIRRGTTQRELPLEFGPERFNEEEKEL